MLYHPRLNVLLLCGDGGGVSGWRLLDGFPHWAPALGQSVEKVGRQGTAASNIVNCVGLCGLGTIVVQSVADILRTNSLLNKYIVILDNQASHYGTPSTLLQMAW